MAIIKPETSIAAQIDRILERLDAGEPLVDVERANVDLKEEAGRRDKGGVILPGRAHNDTAAIKLASEAACMANTPGGGALILGVANDGALIGTNLEVEWLRHRIYELTNRLLTVDIREALVGGKRLLVLISPYAVEPVRMHGRIHWRLRDHCVEVDAATWHQRRMQSLRYDWSGDISPLPVTAARPQAIAVARQFLAASGDPKAEELAKATDKQLLRRLNAAIDGHLTNAGVLLFADREHPALDYMHRNVPGGDSTARVKAGRRSVLEELAEVFVQVEAHNPIRHMQSGLQMRQARQIPRLAAREAIVNGVAHREWGLPDPTLVEHIGGTLRVTSPGGFFGGVNESNIITHPSASRNAALTQMLSDLRIAEREGIGVDRMVREMIRLGYHPPVIREIEGPYVRTTLVGDDIDQAWVGWLDEVQPETERENVSSLILLQRLVNVGWLDEQVAARAIQLDVEEARGALAGLRHATVGGNPILAPVAGVPEGACAAWRLSDTAKNILMAKDEERQTHRTWPTRREIAYSYAQARGRISSTELASLVGAEPANVGAVLKDLAAAGDLEPSSLAGRGRGFYYRWCGTR